MNIESLSAKILALKKEKNAVILAHYYTLPEVQAVADYLGDSLALSVKAKDIKERVILFAGVHFMAETAKVLCPDKKVLIPRPEASCSLADSCCAEKLMDFKREHKDHVVVSYVNTTVEVKALTDVCCTSSNALKVIKSIPQTKPIIFTPDRNLGSYIIRETGRKNILLWDGACHVHDAITPHMIEKLKKEYPKAKVVVHPECRKEVDDLADYIGSTAGILEYCGKSEAVQFIVVTEKGIMAEMKKRYPDKKFIHVSEGSEDKNCGVCEYMKMVTLEDIYQCLSNESNEVLVEEELREKAKRSIEEMIK